MGNYSGKEVVVSSIVLGIDLNIRDKNSEIPFAKISNLADNRYEIEFVWETYIWKMKYKNTDNDIEDIVLDALIGISTSRRKHDDSCCPMHRLVKNDIGEFHLAVIEQYRMG